MEKLLNAYGQTLNEQGCSHYPTQNAFLFLAWDIAVNQYSSQFFTVTCMAYPLLYLFFSDGKLHAGEDG